MGGADVVDGGCWRLRYDADGVLDLSAGGDGDHRHKEGVGLLEGPGE